MGCSSSYRQRSWTRGSAKPVCRGEHPMLEGEELEKDTYISLEVAQKKEKQVNTSQETKEESGG